MIFYHVTTAESAEAILAHGFRDSESDYGIGMVTRGVWLSHRPLDGSEGTKGDTVLEVSFPEGTDLDDWEWVQEGTSYREWQVPAELINTKAQVRYAPPDDEYRGPAPEALME